MDEFIGAFQSGRKNRIVKPIVALPSSYIGSKKRLLAHIYDTLEKEEIRFSSVFDAFSGSAMVSLLFQSMGKKVYCNDILTSSSFTARCLLNTNCVNVTLKDLEFLCQNKPSAQKCKTFVLDNYKNKFFTESECVFLDRYRRNVEEIGKTKFQWGMELLNKAILASIPNSNFSVYGKNLKNLRSQHDVDRVFNKEKWRDTTRKRRDANNEIMFFSSLSETLDKYNRSFPLKDISGKQKCEVYNADIIQLLESGAIRTDLLYLDPPYGTASSDYAHLYKFLEEYLYESTLDNLSHIQNGSRRFVRHKGYQEQFEKLLSLSGHFKTWLISYNDSSYANLDVIIGTIKNAGKNSVRNFPVPLNYQYRAGNKKGTEYLILAS